MRLSTIVFLVWVFLVSIAVRGWTITSFSLGWAVLVVGVIFIVLSVLEGVAIVTYKLPTRHRRAVVAPAE